MSIRKSALNYFHRLGYRQHQAKLARNSAGCSRANEATILKQLIADLLPADHHRTAVDIGAGDGVRWSNSYDLFSEGWRGVGVEGDSRKVMKLARAYRYYPKVYACRARVTPHTIAPLLRAYEIEKNFSVLSLDIDGNDYWVLRAILSEFRPRLVVTEINEKIPPPVRFIVKYNPDFELRHHFFGYSIASLADLCAEFGYSIVGLEYNNAFLAANELPGAKGLDAETAYREGYRDRPDRKEKFATNFDMDWVQSLSPEEAIKSLHEFYAKYPGEYYLSL
ncbi:MAG: hypothetical protein ABI596_10405, partial [Pyrinomonadaceae bacterium]